MLVLPGDRDESLLPLAEITSHITAGLIRDVLQPLPDLILSE
jgi:hypothetical protein